MLKIVSGGQTGADVAGLWIGKIFNIETGGWAPKGFKTLVGDFPQMSTTFGLKEHTHSYRGRTISNIKDSDLTIVCYQKLSAGSKLTINQCKEHNKKCIKFLITENDYSDIVTNESSFSELVNSIRKNQLIGVTTTINVAGNSTQNCDRAFEYTFKMLYSLFTLLGLTPSDSLNNWKQYKDRWE